MSLANVGLRRGPDLGERAACGPLEEQALVPDVRRGARWSSGLAGQEDVLLERLRAEPLYPPLFAQAFPEEADPISLASVTRALAAFQRTLISGRSPYDRAKRGGEPAALSEAARRGETLFFSEDLECFHCHGGFAFSDSVVHARTTFLEITFHNTALYNVDGAGAYPETDRGLYEISGEPRDMGRFRAPTLRNIAVTAPYMHDGSAATLDDVIDHYAAGGRRIDTGPQAGDGAQSPLKSEFVNGFELTPDQRADLHAFLESLTDEAFLADPRLGDPWKSQ
jgi:cytochrome c peroxidase